MIYVSEKFNAKNVVVGMDTRTSSEMIKAAVISGLLSAGCNIYDSGVVPIPAIQLLLRKKFINFYGKI